MGYVLLILLLAELFLFYRFNGKIVVSPSFLGCAVFIFSTVMYLLAGDYYQYDLHLETVMVIITLLMCVFLGEVFANRLRIKSEKQHTVNVYPIPISKVMCFIISVVVLGLSMLRFYEVYQFSLTVGNEVGNIWGMAKYVREAQLKEVASLDLSLIAGQGVLVSEAIVFYCVYCLGNYMNRTGKFYWRFIWPILCYAPNIIATDNRTALLRMVTICVIILFVLYKQKFGWKSKGNFKLIIAGMAVVFAFLVVFRMLGYRTDASLRSETWDNITEYTSASLVGLDKYLLNGEGENTIFGQGTLKNIYNILRQWGFPIPSVEKFEAFYSYARGDSNIYTAFKVYIKDYTMIGAALAMFLWGAVINYNMKYIRQNGAGFMRVCIVGMLFYPVMMLSIEDVTSTVLAISTLYTFVYLFFIDMIFVKQKIRFNFGGR